MAAPIAANRRQLAVALAVLLLGTTLALAQTQEPAPLGEGAFDLNADAGLLDPRSDAGELSGNVRITQSGLSMLAQKATVIGMQTDHATWIFKDSVHISTTEAELNSDSASAQFADGELARAIAQGSPATFERRGVAPDKIVRGRADTIEYNFDKGIVRLSNNVWFSQGGNEFRGDTLIYYVHDERVVMNPGGKQSGRVNVTIRPRNSSGKSSATLEGSRLNDSGSSSPANDSESGA